MLSIVRSIASNGSLASDFNTRSLNCSNVSLACFTSVAMVFHFLLASLLEPVHYSLQEREKAKIVECKIRSTRSRLLFLLSGVFSPVGWHHVKRTWTRSRDLSEFPGCKGLKTRWMCKKKLLFLFSRCLDVEVFIKVSIQSVLVMNLEENERFLGIWPLYLPIRE